MNKAELTAKLAARTNITRSEASKILDATLDIVQETLVSGEQVTLVGFGIFTPKQRKERQGRNPKTGEPALIHAQKTASFKISKVLKDAMNH